MRNYAYKEHLLSSEGILTDGIVVKQVLNQASDNGTSKTSYEVDYTFTAADRRKVAGQDMVHADGWDQMQATFSAIEQNICVQLDLHFTSEPIQPDFALYGAQAAPDPCLEVRKHARPAAMEERPWQDRNIGGSSGHRFSVRGCC
jgi:hypothetical protein